METNQAPQESGFQFGIYGIIRMTFKNNKNISIETNSPDFKLSVNGTTHAKELKVGLTSWSGFVFKNTYNLPTIEEVETIGFT